MRPRVSLRDALTDPHLLGHVLAGESWLPWRVLLLASMGEALTDDERVVFKQLTGREREPLQRVNDLAIIAGRRGGKTSAVSALATYIAACCDHGDALARAETGVLLCAAQDSRVATKILDFVEANTLRSSRTSWRSGSPMLPSSTPTSRCWLRRVLAC
ncbi:MAG: hypothetical protein AUI16_08340 [Alphaproteobacteria bacterium 13_2_20CM_2_64_7]|nr:MAG: hypothetical protein AUI16_08340 [Alphaproteobacteria bacterium 13_2_20CM_2_64_7]